MLAPFTTPRRERPVTPEPIRGFSGVERYQWVIEPELLLRPIVFECRWFACDVIEADSGFFVTVRAMPGAVRVVMQFRLEREEKYISRARFLDESARPVLSIETRSSTTPAEDAG